jgi:hypothetical protein
MASMSVAFEPLPPAAVPAAVLRCRAAIVERVLAGDAPVPPRWVAPAFVQRVERVRAHLSPIQSVDTLLSSYGREARLLRTGTFAAVGRPQRLDAPLELAYVLRLIELDSGIAVTPWATIMTRAAGSRHGDLADPGDDPSHDSVDADSFPISAHWQPWTTTRSRSGTTCICEAS